MRSRLMRWGFCAAVFGGSVSAQTWDNFARDAQHSADAHIAVQPLNQIHWRTPVDLQPQYSGGELFIHYGSPLITQVNTVLLPVKISSTDGFRVDGRDGNNGSLKWSLVSDYISPPHDWIPVFGPALTSRPRLYFPGAGGTVHYRNDPDESQGITGRIAFYGTNQYTAHAAAFNSSVFINTPITSDFMGNIYFGFEVTGS